MTDLDLDAEWRKRANCRTIDPDAMQPDVATPAEVAEAKAVCNGCPVLEQCRELAASQDGGAYGVHAGEWWGFPPERPGVAPALCQGCGVEVPPKAHGGLPRKWCDPNCGRRTAAREQRVSA